MEIETKTKKTDKIKNFMRNNSGVIIGSSVSLVAGGLLGYKIGHNKGIRVGRNKILDEIVGVSSSNGLIMNNPELGRYVFTAKKFDN